MFHHFCFQWCKNFPKNKKMQFSSSFFHFFYHFLSFFIIFHHFLSFFINSTTGSKNDKKMKKTWGKLQFSIFWIFFCTTGRKNDKKMIKNDKKMKNKMIKNDKNMIKKWKIKWLKKNEWKHKWKKQINKMITKTIKKWKKIFWPGPVCGCKFFIKLLFFFVLLEKISYIWPPVIEQHFFFNLPCKVFSTDSFWPAFPIPSTGYDLSCAS